MAKIDINLSTVDYTTNTAEAFEAFKDWTRAQGYPRTDRRGWQEEPHNGVKMSARLMDEHGRDGAAMAHFFADARGIAGVIFKYNGDAITWTFRQANGQRAAPIRFTPEELAAMRERAEREAERARAAQLAAFEADTMAYFNDSLALGDAPASAGVKYLERKGVTIRPPLLRIAAHDRPGAPFIPAGSLIVPLFNVLNVDGGPVAYQWITRDCKLFRGGARQLCPWAFWIGDPRGASIVTLAEGLATAATWFQMTGLPTGSTCDAGNLKKTALALLATYPRLKIIIAADDDFLTEARNKGNKGRSTAAAIQARHPRRVHVALPPWPRTEMIRASAALEEATGQPLKLSDWNDLYTLNEASARRAAEREHAAAVLHFTETAKR